MSNWQRTLDIKNSWELVKEYEMSQAELAKEIAEKLKLLKPFKNQDIDWEKEEIIEEFENLADDEDENQEWFNYAMNKLYDWADTSLDGKFGGKKVCWVKTF